MKFFNREKEIKELNHIINKDLDGQDNLYFVIGQMNNGKTTLFMEFLNKHIDKDKFVPMYKNLRVYFALRTVDDFFSTFFSSYKPAPTTKSKKLKIDTKYGKFLLPEKEYDEMVKKKNYYNKIIECCKTLRNEGKIPIIVVDEIYLIDGLEEEHYKMEQIFELFVALNKLSLAKVFIVSSDSLFIKNWYRRPSIYHRSNLLWIDDFDKESALKFADYLAKKEGIELTEEEKEYLYDYVGGNPNSIRRIIDDMDMYNISLKESIDRELKTKTSQYSYRLESLRLIKPELYKKVMSSLESIGENFKISEDELEDDIISYLAKEYYIFLDLKGNAMPHTKLSWYAIREVVKEHRELKWID